MMLDIHRDRVRFRLRLYGHLGYVGDLGRRSESLEIGFVSRVVVDHGGSGIRAVPTW